MFASGSLSALAPSNGSASIDSRASPRLSSYGIETTGRFRTENLPTISGTLSRKLTLKPG